MNHLSNVLRARTLAGDSHTIDYDEAFRHRASHNELARWNLRNNDIWLEIVGPHTRTRGEVDRRKQSFQREINKKAKEVDCGGGEGDMGVNEQKTDNVCWVKYEHYICYLNKKIKQKQESMLGIQPGEMSPNSVQV